MKKLLSVFVLIGFLISCDDKKCDDVICGQNQACNQGTCYCADGYEGTNCVDIASDKYIGQYNISKSCSQGSGGFSTFGTVQADGSPVNELLFYNFLGTGITAYAYIGTDQNGEGNYLRFPDQNLGVSEIIGEGYYQDYGSYGRISISIQSTINGQVSVCDYTYY